MLGAPQLCGLAGVRHQGLTWGLTCYKGEQGGEVCPASLVADHTDENETEDECDEERHQGQNEKGQPAADQVCWK